MPAFEPLVLVAALATIVVGLLAWALLRRRRAPVRGHGRAPRREATQAAELVARFQPAAVRVLTAGEREVFETVRRALPRHIVIAQVPLVRYLRAQDAGQTSQWMRELSMLGADILVCDASARPLLAIDVHPAELAPRAAKRHLRLKQLLEGAGVRMLVIHADRLPTVAQMRALIEPVLPAPENEGDAEGIQPAAETPQRIASAPAPARAAAAGPGRAAAAAVGAAAGPSFPLKATREPEIVLTKRASAASLSLPVPDLTELLAEGDDIAARHPAMEPVSLTFFDEFEPLQRTPPTRPH